MNGIEKPEVRKESKPIHVFISYSSDDIDYKEKLKDHLMPLVRLNKAILCDNSSIDAGEEENEK